jgi:hypothetical protein
MFHNEGKQMSLFQKSVIKKYFNHILSAALAVLNSDKHAQAAS